MGNRWIGVALATLLTVAGGPVRAQVDVERYIKREGYERIKISPDGLHYAATFPTEDRTGLVILRRSDKKVMATSMGRKGSVIANFWWGSNDRVVIAPGEKLGSRDEPYRTGALYSLGVESAAVKELVTGVYATFLDTIPDEPGKILISIFDPNYPGRTSVEKLDVYTARSKQVAYAPIRRASFATDIRGEVRFAVGAKDDNFAKTYYRQDTDADWQLINDEAQSGHVETPLGFAADGVTAYLQVEQKVGPDSIVAWNTQTGERKEVMRDGVVDPYDILYDRDGRSLIGAQFMDGGVRTRFVDEKGETARLYRSLEKAFPDATPTITSFTSDGQMAMVVVWNDRISGDYYLFDLKNKTANGVAVVRQWFNPDTLPKSRGVTLQARDGVTLRGYLTLPVGQGAQPLPLVIMPHGGPFYIYDQWGFVDDAMMLAEAGYAVLRINFRGSGNYGDHFADAGAREWGGRMQDDLTDATRWAIEQKIADPKRICIYGASYGGYAALMGVAKEPDLYRCAVGYIGIYDLRDAHRDHSRGSPAALQWANDWMGERESLDQKSPTTMAQRIKAPVFLVAGGEDTTAPISHSKSMERALRDAGVPVETLYVSTEGHGFYAKEHQRDFYTRLLEFLSRHLGGAKAKVEEAAGAKTAR